MKILQVTNICGYPSLGPRIKEFAEKHNALIIVGTANLLTLKEKELQSERMKIVIEAIAGLESFSIPVVGYSVVRGRYSRCEMHRLSPKPRKIKVPTHHRRLPTEMYMELMAAKSKRKFIDALDPKAETTGIARFMLSPILRASEHDPVPKTKEEKAAEHMKKAVKKTVNKSEKSKKSKKG